MESRVLFEIDAGGVGGAIFTLARDGRPKILFTERKSSGLEKKFDTDHLLSSMKRGLEQVAASLLGKLPGKAEKIYCLLSSPFLASQNLSLRLEYREPVLITKELLNFLVQKEIEDFESQHLAGDGDTQKTAHDMVEKKIQMVKLNGYASSEPFGKKAKRLEAHTFVSIMPSLLRAEISEFLGPRFQFDGQKIEFHSFLFCLFNLVRDIIQKDNFILTRLGEEVTDLGLVKESVLLDVISYPYGVNTLLRQAAQALGTLPEEIAAHLGRAGQEGMDSNAKLKVAKEVDAAVAHWQGLFQSSAQGFLEESFLPNQCLLSGSQEASRHIQNSLEKQGYRVKAFSDILRVPLEVYERGVKEDHNLSQAVIFVSKIDE